MDFKNISDSLVEGFKVALNNVSLEDLKYVVPNSSADTLKTLIQSIKEHAEHLNPGDVNTLWKVTKEFCYNNPIQITFLLLDFLTFTSPLFFARRLLALLGFASHGPVVASIVARLQAIHGVNVIWSTLQSAAMGGYGAPIVAGGVRAGAVAGAAVNLVKGFWYNSTETAST